MKTSKAKSVSEDIEVCVKCSFETLSRNLFGMAPNGFSSKRRLMNTMPSIALPKQLTAMGVSQQPNGCAVAYCVKLMEGIVTSNAYNSAHGLTETRRSEVYDGDICVTSETIAEYTRDAAGRVLSTTRRIGTMVITEFSGYDSLGRETKQVDVLGRETITEYSVDGPMTTVTTPAGTTFITVQNTDGSAERVAGTGQREQMYIYDLNGNSERMTTKLSDGSIIGQSITNGFGQTVVEAFPNTLNGFIYTRSEFNAKGQVVKSYQDTGLNTAKTAATLYEYDSFGNQVKRTLALNTTQKQLISQRSAILKSKTISTDVRSNNSALWDEYSAPEKVTSFTAIPTSNVTDEVVSVDGLTISQKNHAGINTGLEVQSFTAAVEDKTITSFTFRRFTATGMEVKQRDGRDNVTTISVDDADGNQTLIKTSIGIWPVVYNAKHRPVSFSCTEGDGTAPLVACAHDSMGRRCFKKVTANGTATLHERYICRGTSELQPSTCRKSSRP